MMKKMVKEQLFDIFLVVLGNFILAFAVSCFIIPNNVLSGGLAGISVALYPVFHIDPQLFITVATYAFFIIGSLLLGKNFAFKTLISTIAYPVFLNAISYFFKGVTFTNNPMLASIYGGAILGLGIGLVFRTGASTGGMDIPPLIINKYTGIPLGSLVMLVDGATVLLGILIHGVGPALIGILSVVTSSIMVNKALSIGGQSSKSIMIISDYMEPILEKIKVDIDRGATVIDAVGAYSGLKKKIILVVISQKQYPLLNKLVSSIDPNAFMIVQDAKEVKGNGFSYSIDPNRKIKIK